MPCRPGRLNERLGAQLKRWRRDAAATVIVHAKEGRVLRYSVGRAVVTDAGVAVADLEKSVPYRHDRQRDAGDEIRLVGGEEERRVGDIPGVPILWRTGTRVSRPAATSARLLPLARARVSTALATACQSIDHP
jgi:hypothetical protein